MKNKFIRIMGAGRSGSTMLNLILGNYEKSFACGEIHAWFRPYRKHHFEIDCSCKNKNCEIWNKVKSVNENNFHSTCFDLLDINFLIDSSKNLVWMIDSENWVSSKEIEKINFLIYKPIISYIYSIWKRGEDVSTAIRRYKVYYSRFFESGLSCYCINYKELIDNPEELLKKICIILNQKYHESRIEFWNKQQHNIYGSDSTRFAKNDNKTIYNEKFSLEFKNKIPEINNLIKNDKELNKIQNLFKEYDLKVTTKRVTSIPKIKPIWYYLHKIKQRYFLFFPSDKKIIS